MINQVAVKHKNTIYVLPKPLRHHDILHSLPEKVDRSVCEQGFLGSECQFLTRKEAAETALETGQIKKLRWPPDLYSEDLW